MLPQFYVGILLANNIDSFFRFFLLYFIIKIYEVNEKRILFSPSSSSHIFISPFYAVFVSFLFLFYFIIISQGILNTFYNTRELCNVYKKRAHFLPSRIVPPR